MAEVVSSKEMQRLVNYLSGLTRDNFYGKLVISYEKGRPVNIRREETIKLGQINQMWKGHATNA